MEFTNEWFKSNIPLWELFLKPLKDQEISVLEIGSYEGQSTVWLLENVITHPNSKIICVDTYKDSAEMKQYNFDWEKIKERFINNTSKWKNKVNLKVEDSTQFLKNCKDTFDLIYIDGNHYSYQVLIDAVQSHLLLKHGGIIIFDDYLYGGTTITPFVPKGAIDAFMTCFAGLYDVLSIGYQVILRKK